MTPRSMDSAAVVNSPTRIPPTTVAMVMDTTMIRIQSVVADPASDMTERGGVSHVRTRLWER